jgi:hypothetical protein
MYDAFTNINRTEIILLKRYPSSFSPVVRSFDTGLTWPLHYLRRLCRNVGYIGVRTDQRRAGLETSRTRQRRRVYSLLFIQKTKKRSLI